MSAILKKVQAARKKLAKSHPGWNSSTLLKAAWKKARGGRVSGVKKKAAKKTARVWRAKVVGTRSRPSVRKATKRDLSASRKLSVSRKKVGGLGEVRSNATESRRILETMYGEFLSKATLAKTKTEKNKARKAAAGVKMKLDAVYKILDK